jgi:SAM-dependent methyltransferase
MTDQRRSELRRAVFEALWAPPVRAVLTRVPLVRRVYFGWQRTHPFDREHGVDTSGMLAPDASGANPALAAQSSPYAGSQPSIVRHVLRHLPDRERYAFVDVGCGKGRPLLVASSLGFARLLGVEMSQQLAEVARANAAKLPAQPAIEVQEGDATAIAPPGPRAVYFLYHPFGAAQVAALAANITAALGRGLEHAFIVYYNPVHAAVFDAQGKLARWSAEEVPYSDVELGYGPDLEDAVVVWQTVPKAYPTRPGAEALVRVDPGGQSASVAPR